MEARAALKTAGVRRLLDKMLPSDADLRAFLLDELGRETYLRFDGIQNRMQLVTAVLVQQGEHLEWLVAALERWDPAAFARHRAVLEVPGNVARPPQEVGGVDTLLGLRQRRDVLWIALGFSSLLAAALMVLLLGNRRGDTLPPVIIIQMAQPERLSEIAHMPNRFDAPEQFVAKVKKAGPENVRFEVGSEKDTESQEYRRLVLALLKQNSELLAAMKYRPSQVQEWSHENRPQGQFLAQLSQRIESTFPAERSAVPDLGITVPVRTPVPNPDPPPPKPLDIKEADQLSGLPSEILRAESLYTNGQFQKAIDLAKAALDKGKLNASATHAAFRIIGCAACFVDFDHRVQWALGEVNNAYRSTDANGRSVIKLACQRSGRFTWRRTGFVNLPKIVD